MWSRPTLVAACLGIVSLGTSLPAQDAAAPGGAKPPSEKSSIAVPGTSSTKPLGPVDRPRPVLAPETVRPLDAALPTDVIYLPGPDGRLEPVPLDTDLVSYLKSRRAKAEQAPAAVPFAVSLVQLDGEADEDRALLKATIQIQVNVEEEWVRVPLSLQDVVLQATTHKGVGEDSFGGFDREAGHRWWLKGRGQHELICTFTAPIRKQGAGRRIQLSLPDAAVTSFALSVPGQATAAKALPEGAWVRTVVKGNRSVIEARGRLARFDLTWQPVSAEEQTQTVLQAETSVALDVSEESLVLEADQAVEAVEGSFHEIRVRMPAGFEFLDVEEKYSRIATTRVESSERPDFVLVQFTEPMKGPVFLHWTLAAAFPKGTGRIVVDGFEVQQAVRQSGEVLIGPADGFRITRREGEAGYVHRSQPSPARASKPWSSAWRFLKQPFKLTLDVQEVEAYYTVEPRWKLHVASGYLELEGLLQVHVAKDRGSVQSLTLDWPTWKGDGKGDGWLLQSVEAPQIVQRVEVEDVDQSTHIRMRLEGRKVGSFQVPFRARRPLAAGTTAFEVNLPAAISSARGPSLVDVTCDENLEADVRRVPPTAADAPPEPAKDDRAANWSRTWKLRIDDAYPRLAIRTMAHPRVVRCESTADVTIRAARLQVVQRMQFQVSYEPLSQLRLLVPKPLAESLGVLYNDKEVLTPTIAAAGLESDPRAAVRVVLPQPRTGDFSLVVRYVLDLPESDPSAADGEGQQAVVPMIVPEETSITATRLRLKGDDVRTLDVVDSRIQPGPADGEWSTFLSSGSLPQAMVRVVPLSRRLSGTMIVERMWVQTWLDPSGAVVGKAVLRIDGASRTFPLRLPASTELTGAEWNGTALPLDRVDYEEATADDSIDGSGRRVDLILGSGAATSGVLTVSYLQNGLQSPGLLRQPELRFPSPESGIPVRETAWELILPPGQHLLSPPDGFAARFRWNWATSHFQRNVFSDFNSPGAWLAARAPTRIRIGDTTSTPSDAAAASVDVARIDELLRESGASEGNRYVFTRIGTVGEASFSSISFAMLVLAGAGSAWLAGLVLVKIPAARNVVTILSCGLATVSLGLVFPASFALMAQPAVAGLLLAALMAALERMLSRDREPPVLTISPASDPGRSGARGSSVARAAATAGEQSAGRMDGPVLRPEIAVSRPELAGTGSSVGGVRP